MISAESTFVHEGLPGRVVFGRGTIAQVPAEAERLGTERVLVVTSPEQEDQGQGLAERLGPQSAGAYPRAVMHVPVGVAREAVDHVRRGGVDGLVALGGGSAIGLAKAVALETGLPVLAVPTTYAGSEMTPVWGLTDEGGKRTGRDRRVLPRTVVYDVDLSSTLPAELSATSAVNALAHAVEALWAPDRSPVTDLMAGSAAEALVPALEVVTGDPGDPDARARLSYGAWLAGSCLGMTTMSLHHKLCHVLGGTFDLPHAWTHTVLLPHVIAFNLPAAPEARERLTRALADDDPAALLLRVLDRLGLRRGLRDLGMPEDGIELAVSRTMDAAYANPREVTETDLRDLLGRAFTGAGPTDVP